MKLQKGPTPPPLIHIPHNYEVYASDLFHIRLFLYFFTDILPYSALFFKGQTMPLAVGRATAHAFSPLPLILQAFPHPVACFWNAAARRKIPPRRYRLPFLQPENLPALTQMQANFNKDRFPSSLPASSPAYGQ